MALFEASKGIAALLGLLGLLSLLHHDLHRLALELIGHMGLSPAQRYPGLFMDAVDKLNVTPVRTVVLVGSLYVAVRLIEAWGLWHDKVWGEWFGIIACAVYIPLEVQHIVRHTSWQAALVLVFNIALVLILLAKLLMRRRAHQASVQKLIPERYV